ncbi:hypothetical protein COW36_22340 [bacterium (Candidatus Blackallbacteria) CG17_big_fil_post_rev_8_21_14_2_50_48_46]|uniref:Uncharacterized protein n=1 Tax=bacterium (Candidatus Blackallbacteria) CG17_big_fil_post_rev_8_21_14_2_50_48_46 TaxID=2014261 RepID=A0A2M7FZP3_9BACT|nr:MAG: hypothetical protein COW64_13770 [bacterium (Candidatus Blackallbacteria) CG18_big_fil_WC_8_21_14_2_50_49_26]PIW14353.1 MAG: hypothetical protein COW36_22340 [bacterium (Candidatus Blackallbacteria) CG17_big_fil_post_rev_8_21_14_2_50_48_46]PIW45622.1 MAG: hypothetical protein COW20_19945 [bacterium (Candidatus Blackallbacteria) CG13_big_fil_rev_8_21_14_2_50_49_14]
MKKYLSLLLVPGLLAGLSSCGPTYSSATFPSMPSPSASPSDRSALSSLIGESVISKEEQQLRDTLQRKIEVKFPLRIGVIYYSYNSQLQSQDQEKIFESVQKNFKDSGLVRETFQISSSLLGNGANIDTVRQLGARFQADIVVIVSGSHQFERSSVQNLSFFDSFTDRSYYESNMTIEAIGLDIFSGTFLNPLRSVVKTEPQLFDRAAADFTSQTYTFRKDAEAKVWTDMSAKFIESLKTLKQEIENRVPTPSASPSTPVPSPSVTPFPEASASPAGGK